MPKQPNPNVMYYRLKDVFYHVDALSKILPDENTTERHFINLTLGELDDILSEYEEYNQASDKRFTQNYDRVKGFNQLDPLEQHQVLAQLKIADSVLAMKEDV